MYFMFRNLKAHLVAQEYPTKHTISRTFPDSRHRHRHTGLPSDFTMFCFATMS